MNRSAQPEEGVQTFMNDLHRRRSPGQRLTDPLLVGLIFPFALIAVLAVTRQDRKAAR